MATNKKAGPGPRKKSAGKGVLTHKDVMEASVRVDVELRRRSELLWDDRLQPTRGPKPGLTPANVVQAAIGIADEEGLAAVTMHAVATRLGFTTMAVYRYFPSKDTLLDAVIDAGTGAPPPLRAPRADWRTEVAQWAHAKRARLCARPWLAELPFVAAPHGPNWLRWLEAISDSLSRTGLVGEEIGQMLSIVDGYARGASDTAVSMARARARGITAAEWAAGVGADLGRAIGDPRFPHFAALITAPSQGKPRTMDESFDFGLQRVLDGIELYVSRSVLVRR